MLTKQNVTAMLLGQAVGDALGVPVEFSWREELKEDPVIGMREYGSWRQPAGTWSDDTSMALAAMESLTRLKAVDYTDVCKNFVRWLEQDEFNANDETFDCGRTCGAAIRNFESGLSPDECGLRDVMSNGNGSLMRIFPAVLYAHEKFSDENAALEVVHKFSALTHAHHISQTGCGIYYFITAQILAGKTLNDAIYSGLNDAKKFYESRADFAEAAKAYSRLFDKNFASLKEYEIKSSSYVVETFEAVIWCLLNTNTYKNALLKVVNLGRDTDTTGAIAGGLAGLFYGLENIPADWLKVLRKRAYLKDMAEKFFKSLTSAG